MASTPSERRGSGIGLQGTTSLSPPPSPSSAPVVPRPTRIGNYVGTLLSADSFGAHHAHSVTYSLQQLGEQLGQGFYGVVYKGFNIETGEFVAIKQFHTDKLVKAKGKDDLMVRTVWF